MNKKLFKHEIAGFVFVSIVGTLLHFAYDWSGKSAIIALIAPINESPWEHLKLLFYPYFAYSIWESIKLKKDKFCVFFGKYMGTILGMWCILSIYYTASGALGKNINWLNILSYFIGVAIAFVISYLLINSSIGNEMPNALALAMMVVTVIAFVLFTFDPPLIPLFRDPQNLTYGR